MRLRVFTAGTPSNWNTMTSTVHMLYRFCQVHVQICIEGPSCRQPGWGRKSARAGSSAHLRAIQVLYSRLMTIETGPTLRIGELSRRVGVSPELLRAWERRYGLLDPARTDGGLRLYSAEDVRRVRAMQAHLQSGLSAAEAARLARSGEGVAAESADTPALQDA